MIYKVIIQETLCKEVEIEAENETDAEMSVRRKYRNEEIILDHENWVEVEIVTISNKN